MSAPLEPDALDALELAVTVLLRLASYGVFMETRLSSARHVGPHYLDLRVTDRRDPMLDRAYQTAISRLALRETGLALAHAREIRRRFE